jgi:hypothetical protein
VKKLYITAWSAILVIAFIILSALPVAADGFTDPVMVKDIEPGSQFWGPERLVDVAGTLLFSADDGANPCS